MLSDQMFANQISPGGDERLFVNCNFSQAKPVRNGDGDMEGVLLWPDDDIVRTIRGDATNLTNRRLKPQIKVEKTGLIALIEHGVQLGGTVVVEHLVDGVKTDVVEDRVGTIVHGTYDPVKRETTLLNEPRQVDQLGSQP